MRREWLYSLAVALGVVVVGPAWGQSTGGFQQNYGASAYPIQRATGGAPHAVRNLPQVPQRFGFQDHRHSPFTLSSAQADEAEDLPAPPAPSASSNSNQRSASPSRPAPEPPLVPPPERQSWPQSGNAGPSASGEYRETYQPHQQSDSGYAGSGYAGGMHDSMGHAAAGAGHCQSCNQALPQGESYFSEAYGQCDQCGPGPVRHSYSGPAVAPPRASFSAPGIFGNKHAGGAFGGHGRASRFVGLPPMAKPWFVTANALLFHRVDDDNVVLSHGTDPDMPARLSTRDARMGLLPGFEIGFGHYFNCGRNAIAVNYWGLFPETEMASVYGSVGDFRTRRFAAGMYQSPVDPNGGEMPYDVYGWYEDSAHHRVDRSSQFHNVEVNLLGFATGGAARTFNRPAHSLFSKHGGYCQHCSGSGCGACAASAAPTPRLFTGPCNLTPAACGSRLNFSWLAGFRYFRFEDQLTYITSINDMVTRDVDDFYYDVNTTNDLYGFQLGSRLDWCLGRRWSFYGLGRTGIYGNRSSLYSRLGTDTRIAYESGTPEDVYLLSESDTDVAFLSEIGAGGGFAITPKWTATAGYRAVFVSGVATSVGNLRGARDSLTDLADYHHRDSLILHGLNVGANYNF